MGREGGQPESARAAGRGEQWIVVPACGVPVLLEDAGSPELLRDAGGQARGGGGADEGTGEQPMVRGLKEAGAAATCGAVVAHEEVLEGLGTHLDRLQGLAGAAILGDGRISLILDVVGLVKIAGDVAGDSTHKGRNSERQP